METNQKVVGYGVDEEGNAFVLALPKFKLGDIVWYNHAIHYISSIEVIVDKAEDLECYYRIVRPGALKNTNIVMERQLELVDTDIIALSELQKAEYEFAKATYEFRKVKYKK